MNAQVPPIACTVVVPPVPRDGVFLLFPGGLEHADGHGVWKDRVAWWLNW